MFYVTIFQAVEDKTTVKRHNEMETEGRLQTVCIREDREYLSLSSWMREETVEDGGERGQEGGARCQR